MKNFNNQEKISSTQMMIAVPSMIGGVGILFLPNFLAVETVAADGWISIVAGGVVTIIIAWCIAKIASSYPGMSFIDYASIIVTRPVAILLTFVFSLVAVSISAYEVRSVSNIAKKYLLEETPIEVVALVFLLVVIYAVAGSRTGLIRLNMLFFPIIVFIMAVVLLFSFGQMKIGHLQPMFQTDFHGYFRGVKSGITSFIGVNILWFYTQYMKLPKKAPRAAVIGVGIVIILYLLVFVVTIAVFGNSVSTNLLYPTIELAKAVEIPGEFFERFESVFFVIWIMAIFNTTAMAIDIAALALTSIFTKVSKLTILYIISPLIFFIAMTTKNTVTTDVYGTTISKISIIYTVCVIFILFVVSKVRRAK